MFKVKRFFSLTLFVIGGLIGASLLTHFSVAQNYGPTASNLLGKSFKFLMPNYPLYLYAITEPNRYTIHFDGNGSTSGNMSNMNVLYDQNVNLIPNKFIKDGFTFEGWSTSAAGGIEYSDQAEVLNLTTVNSGEITLYAQWTDNEVPYIIEYYQENVDGTGYDLVDTGTDYGTVGPHIITTGQIYTGFTLQTGTEVNIVSGGTVPYYYMRNTYNLTVKDRDDVLINSGIKYGANIPLPADPEWTGNSFDGWNNLPGDGKMPANDLELTSRWTYGEHTITFDTDGGTEVAPITANYGDVIEVPAPPTKDGYEFVRWEPALPTTMPYDDIIVKAIWKEVSKGGGWSGGGGRGGGSTDEPEGEQEHGSATQNPEGTSNKGEMEVLIAYMWARNRGIVETPRKISDPDGYIPRGDMAEMLVKFTENVLGKKIPSRIPAKCSWGDPARDWKSPETKVYAEKACALGVMGIRMDNFMPNKLVDRAEFGTILSRLLRGDKYDVVDATATKLYYARHLEALNREGIMTQIENPTSRYELRKWAWLMLMRVKS